MAWKLKTPCSHTCSEYWLMLLSLWLWQVAGYMRLKISDIVWDGLGGLHLSVNRNVQFSVAEKTFKYLLYVVKSIHTYHLVMAVIRWTCDPSPVFPVRQSPRGSWGQWSLPRPGSCPPCCHWPRRQQQQCQRWGSRRRGPGSSPHWTTSRKWSIAGWTGCR